MDGSGNIDYSEFVVATINKKQLLTQDKLFQAFKIFDKDGGGSISPDEIKKILELGNADSSWTSLWLEVLKEAHMKGFHPDIPRVSPELLQNAS